MTRTTLILPKLFKGFKVTKPLKPKNKKILKNKKELTIIQSFKISLTTSVVNIKHIPFVVVVLIGCIISPPSWNYEVPDHNDLNKTYKGVRLFDVIFLYFLCEAFPDIVQEKQYKRRAYYAFDLVREMDCPFYKNMDSLTIKEIFCTVFSNIREDEESLVIFWEKVKSETIKKNPELVEKEIKDCLKNYFFITSEKFKNGNFLYFSKDTLPPGNLLTGIERIARPGNFVSFDTTDRFRSYSIVVLDMCSKCVLSIKTFDSLITPKELVEFFETFFIEFQKIKEDDGDPRIIIHGDSDDCNVSLALRKFFLSKGITFSLAASGCENTLSENFNHMLWSLASRLQLIGKEDILFRELESNDKALVVKECAWLINSRIFPKVWGSENRSSYFQFCAYFIYGRPLQLTSERNNKTAELIQKWKDLSCVLLFNRLIQMELEALFNISINLAISPGDFFQNAMTFICQNPSPERELKIVSCEYISVDSIKEILIEIAKCNTLEEILTFITSYIEEQKKYKREKKFLLYKLTNLTFEIRKRLQLNSLNNIMYDAKGKVRITDLLVMSSEDLLFHAARDLGEHFSDDSSVVTLSSIVSKSSILSIRKEQDRELVDKKLRKEAEAREIQSISKAEFTYIFNSIKFKDLLLRDIDKIAHAILQYSGLNINVLKYITLNNLSNLFNNKKIIIKIGKKKTIMVPVIYNGIGVANLYWEDLKQLLNQRGFNNQYYNKIRSGESEIWGDKNTLSPVLTLQNFKTRMDSHLKAPGKNLDKNLTTDSYILGFVNPIAKKLGIQSAKNFLKSTDILVDNYLSPEISETELLEMYKAAHETLIPEEKNFDGISDHKIFYKMHNIICKK